MLLLYGQGKGRNSVMQLEWLKTFECDVIIGYYYPVIDSLSFLQKSLDRALFLYNLIHEVRSSGVRGSITIMHIRKFFKLHHNIVRFRFFSRMAKMSMPAHNVTTQLQIRNTDQCFEQVEQQFRKATSGFVCNRPFSYYEQ